MKTEGPLNDGKGRRELRRIPPQHVGEPYKEHKPCRPAEAGLIEPDMETTGNLVFGRLKARIHDQFLSPETQESARAFRYHISAVYEKRAVMRECLALCLMEIRRTAAIGGRVLELALRYVPEQHKTGELCLEVMKQLGRAFKFVPEKLKTPELCLCAVSS